YKAGSQWLYKILHDSTPELLSPPKVKVAEFLRQPVQANKVYPTIYVTKEEFDTLQLPARWRRFVIIRDLRDTLISFYFSLKVSHPLVGEHIRKIREALYTGSEEQGMVHL